MADQTFDVVIVGGGNKALILAMYLTKYGKMSVGIFEERHELGGGWCQEEPAAGFMANPCSHYHCGFYHIPTYWDFPEWKDYGARYAYSPVPAGCAFKEDDTCLLMYSAFEDVDPTQEKTAAEIARFSEQDAEAYLKLWDDCQKYWEPALLEHMFTPAQPMDTLDTVERMVRNPESGIDPLWLFMSELQLFKDIFVDPHVRHSFIRLNQSLGYEADLAMAGLGSLFNTMFYWPLGCWAVGSSHVLTHASHKVILENGGKVFTNHNVEKVLIENGQAKGIKLSDGSEIKAKQAVVTTVDPYQLCFDLIGKEHLPSQVVRRVENIERDWICLMWYTWALKEAPQYKCESWNPDARVSQDLALSDMDMRTFITEACERKMNVWPSKLNVVTCYHGESETSPGDSLLAPPDVNFTCLTEQFVVPAWALSDEKWKELETQHAEEVIKIWSEYTTNMSWDNVSGYIPVTPNYTANQCKNFSPAGNWCVIDNTPAQWGKFRPIPELAGHKVPDIKGLYCTGSAWHPWGAAHSAQGYNCYKIMSDDLGLSQPWKKEGRPF